MKPPFLAFSKRRPPFHDGANEAHARIAFDCRVCNATIEENALACLSAGADGYAGLAEDARSHIARACGTQDARFPNGRCATFCTTACPQCRARYVLAIDFHEQQPARYIGVLQALAGFPADDVCAPPPHDPA